MNSQDNKFIDTDAIGEMMSRAISLAAELSYRLENADMYDEVKLVRQQALCCYRTLAQIQNVEEISRYTEGRVRSVEFNLSEHLEDLGSAIRSRLRSSQIQLEFDIEPGIIAVADPDRLSVCVVNLLVNAIQNVDAEEGYVRLSLKVLNGVGAISIVDNGYGMSQKELQERLGSDKGANGFDVMKLFCDSVGTTPIFETTESGGFSVTLKIPIIPPPPDMLEFRQGRERIRIDNLSPAVLLIYKHPDASVIL